MFSIPVSSYSCRVGTDGRSVVAFTGEPNITARMDGGRHYGRK